MSKKDIGGLLAVLLVTSTVIGMVLHGCGFWWGLIVALPGFLCSAVMAIMCVVAFFIIYPLCACWELGRDVWEWCEERIERKCKAKEPPNDRLAR